MNYVIITMIPFIHDGMEKEVRKALPETAQM